MSIAACDLINLLHQVIDQGAFVALLYHQKLINNEVYTRWLEAQWNILWELHAKLKEVE